MSAGDFDVVVVGAGVAGSACAAMLARQGLRVLLVDGREEDAVGARWVNGVPAVAFDAAGIERPVGEELHSAGHDFVLVSPGAKKRVTLVNHGLLEVDMRLLGARMRTEAQTAGATLRFGSPVRGAVVTDGRVRAIEVGTETIPAALFVDASGMRGVVRRERFPAWPALSRENLCLAAQAVHEITDPQGAERYLEQSGARDGMVLARAGVAGGFSILNIRVDLAAREISILTGSVQDQPGRPSGVQILERFIVDNPWIGARHFGGSGAIPLRRPFARLSAPGLALLGDAGGMMFCGHGSGIATGLLAARQLADALRNASDLGSDAVTWRYAAAYHRAQGGLLLAYDLIRRATQAMTADEQETLMSTGIVSEASIKAGLLQEPPPLGVGELARTGSRALRAPRLAARMGLKMRNLPATLAHGRTYPLSPDSIALAAYEARSAALVGDPPDSVV
jgi:flavin-dependent dehydrogenase